MKKLAAGIAIASLLSTGSIAMAETITIATVNNKDMIIMQKLTPTWEKQTGNTVRWVVLEENALRQRVTTDIATHSGQFDVVTIGAYETAIWAKNGWLTPLSDLGADYDYSDILAPVRNGLSIDGKMYAVPFYAESSFTIYRKDLFSAAGLTMPDQPTWAQVGQFADKLTDRDKSQYGICLRGKPGWGENMGLITTIANTYGGRWFDMKWNPQLTTKPWEQAVTFYTDLLRRDGPPGASSNGFQENEALFASGKCAIWVDATSAAGRLYDTSTSKVADDLAFASAPIAVTPKGAAWFWAWSLAIPTTTRQADTAKAFVKWATSKEYVRLVASSEGWVAAPPGTRQSTYDNPGYQKAAPFAARTLKAIMTVDPAHPTLLPVPYTGIQYVAIPQFQGIGTSVGQSIAGVVANQGNVGSALASANQVTTGSMRQAGYLH